MGKYNFDWNANDYKTPPVLYEMALSHWGIDKFDLDTCCTVENIPAREYCKNGQTDGLSFDWRAFNWCNPPFNECRKWIAKAYLESQKGNKTAMLIPARTETAYWHEYILFNPDVKIEWLRKGYKFLNRDNEEMGVFKNALAIVYFEGGETGMKKANETCPSYDCGFCETFPTPYSVKCGGDETKNCKWLNCDFTKMTYEECVERLLNIWKARLNNETVKH